MKGKVKIVCKKACIKKEDTSNHTKWQKCVWFLKLGNSGHPCWQGYHRIKTEMMMMMMMMRIKLQMLLKHFAAFKSISVILIFLLNMVFSWIFKSTWNLKWSYVSCKCDRSALKDV